MAGRGGGSRPSVITDARVGTSLSTDQRMHRYLLTMAFRVAAFFAAVVTPLPWNIALLLAAAILPGLAVLLANAVDNRPDPPARPLEEERPLELTTGVVVQGSVEDDDTAARAVPQEEGRDA